MLRRSLFGLFALTALATAVGCQDTPPAEERDATETTLVAGGFANDVTVNEDSLVIPTRLFGAKLRRRIDTYRSAIEAGQSPEAVEPVLLVGDRQADATDATGELRADARNPYGFIRRAVAYREEGAVVIIDTEQAALDEVFTELNEGRTLQAGVLPQADETPDLVPLVQKTFKKTLPLIEWDDKVVFDKNGAKITIKGGSVSLATAIDVGAEISGKKVDHVHAIVDTQLGSTFTIELSGERGFTASPSADVFEGSWPVGAVGPVPVTLAVKVTVGCDVKTTGRASAGAAIAYTAGIKSGVVYDKGKPLEPVFDGVKVEPTLYPPTFDVRGKAEAKCYLRPQVSVLLFDVAGPYVTPTTYGKLAATSSPKLATVSVGLTATVGAKLTVFGKDLGSYEKDVYAFEKELWRSN